MIIENSLMIDEFSPGFDFYFLTHFHSDHYKGLNSKWQNGIIIASKLTCLLLREKLGVEQNLLFPIDNDETYSIKNDTISFTAFDAGHCLGALMFLFKINNKKILYTGDFRLNDSLREKIGLFHKPDILYLDSTYEKFKIKFPTQEEAINKAIEIIENFSDDEIYIATYTIGKNKFIKSICDYFCKQVYVSDEIFQTWKIIEQHHYATRDIDSTNFYAYQRQWFTKKNYMPNGKVAIIPTAMPGVYDYIKGSVFRINYSEHCDYLELEEFKKLTKPKYIIKI